MTMKKKTTTADTRAVKFGSRAIPDKYTITPDKWKILRTHRVPLEKEEGQFWRDDKDVDEDGG